MKRTLYIKIVNTNIPGCEVNMSIEGDCSEAHRDAAFKFVESICTILGWSTVQVEHESTYTVGNIVDE